MGLFSSKYVTNVATTVARVIEDHSLPDSVMHGATKGLFDGSDQFIEHILEELVGSVGIRADHMYNYGKKKYVYGLPSGSIHDSAAGASTVKSTIESIVGQGVVLDYYKFGALNNLHLGWTKLVQDHGYNAKTNILGVLTADKGKPVMLTNVAVVVTEATLLELSNGSLDQWGAPADAGSQATGDGIFDSVLRNVNSLKKRTLFELDAAATNDYLRVEYIWQDSVIVQVEGVSITRQQMVTGSFRIEVIGFDEEADWHQAKYTRTDGEIGYWLYEAGAGTYPVVDALHNSEHASNGSYFPFGYFRFNKTSGIADKNSDWFKHSKKLMKYVGLDYEAVTTAIHENPGIDDVEQAMLIMAVPAVTEDQMEMRYLFDYFNQLKELTGGNLQAPRPPMTGGSLSEKIANTLDSSRTDGSIVIQDARFKMALGFRHIFTKIIQGSIGAVDTYTSGYGSEIITETGTNTNGGGPVSWNTPVKYHYYRKQINETQYEEVRVMNLKMAYFIYEQYTAVGDENDDILLIPVDRSITRRYSIPDREKLYARGLHYVFNSRTITEVKWYQQGWFRFLLVIVAIVITIFSYGRTWKTIGLALAAGAITIQAVIYMLVIGIIKQLLIGLVIRLFVKVVGVKIAFIVAVVAAIAGSYQAIEAGSIAGAPWAKELITLSTSLAKGVNTELNRGFNQLQDEADAFSIFVKSEEKRLKEAQELLDNSNWLTPIIIFGEKPDDYYQRTVHSGNIGVLSLDAISAYVDVSLTLPKLTDTL